MARVPGAGAETWLWLEEWHRVATNPGQEDVPVPSSSSQHRKFFPTLGARDLTVEYQQEELERGSATGKENRHTCSQRLGIASFFFVCLFFLVLFCFSPGQIPDFKLQV